ncbi:MAG: T9SS type A sorting domain-containing protein [Chitinophagaceae bacterium]|nr:T9SS type A sorting domain-containing protein [Chitinophagaceae bacterium]
MKKWLPIILLVGICMMSNVAIVQAQTFSFNTQTMGTGYNGANGQTGITFVIQNTSPFPAQLTSLSNYFASGGTRNFTLWYSSTSLSGSPGAMAAPNWSPVASVANVNCTAGTQTVVFPILAFTIPANTTYRFLLESPTITLSYTTAGAGVTPNIFSNSGVNLLCGDYQIAGQNVGYGWSTAGDFNPRGFTGSITINLLSLPCSGSVTGGTASVAPNNPCPGIPVTMSVSGNTNANGIAYQWLRSSSATGPWLIVPGANTNPYSYTPPAGSSFYYRCIVTCLNNGSFDTSVVSGVNTVQAWSPTSPCYCTSAAIQTADEEITNVTFGTLNNTTNCATPFVGSQGTGTGSANLYTNFTGLGGPPAPTFIIGLPQPFSMTVSSCGTFNFNNAFKAYIDYNHNATFTDPGEEIYWSGPTALTCVPPTTVNGSFTVPATALPGLTRMRIINWEGGQTTPTTITPCSTYGYGETEDYLVNINPAGPYDITVTSMVAPTANNCTGPNETLSATVCNYGGSNINLALNPVTVVFNVSGPNGLSTYSTTLNVGTLNAYGASCQTATINNANLYAGGNYSINATASSSLSNANTSNDSLYTPISITNYRPTAGPDFPLCQYSDILFGQGLTVSGCSVPLSDSVTLNFVITGPCTDNIGATATGTGAAANCADQYACAFANAVMPTLPPGAYFTSPAILTVTNLATIGSSYASEVRMNLYGGSSPTGTNLYSPGAQGATGTGSANFTYTRNVSTANLSAAFSGLAPGSLLNMGYWESYNDVVSGTDININAGGGSTVATLKIYYQYVPPNFSWYDVPSGGVSLSSLSPFDPLSVTNAVVNNSNVPGTYTFYAACQGLSSCRVPVNLIINPTPSSVQDTLSQCEAFVSSNYAIFDLTTMNNSVSGNNGAASVQYFSDQALINLVPFPSNDTSSTNFVYSKVYYSTTGCYSSDSLYLKVNTLPEFPSPILPPGFACAPNSIDVASLINPFSTPGDDTLYYSDAACTIPHPNPHAINTVDTVYIVFVTNTTPACSDTAMAYVDVLPASNYIASQDIQFNYSVVGPVGCNNFILNDGDSDTLRTSNDCKRVAAITDVMDGTSLGSVSICEEIDASTQFHNGQPYVNRHYEITPTANDSAIVCLYFLDDDFQQYNASAIPIWPALPTAASPGNVVNMAITKVDNGDLNTPGHIATAIPNTLINTTYDPSTTVWTVCFPVSGFSFFYAHSLNPNNIPLPVHLLSFTGNKVDQTSLLQWTTSSEQNNSHFIVQKSKDGKGFSDVSAAIPSKANQGNSQTPLDYQYTDMTPYNGHNYYRLQQHDLDGHTSYSQIADVYFGNESIVTLYPNPVNTILYVDIQTPKSGVAKMKIMDATGRVVRAIDMQLVTGQNQTTVDLNGLADGVYNVRISNNKEIEYTQTIRKN